MDISKTYPDSAGVKNWIRTLSMDKQKGIATIKDDYTMNNVPLSLTQSFMTVCNTDISTPGIVFFEYGNNKKMRMQYDASTWKVVKEKMPLDNYEDKKLKENWKDKDIWRILLVSKSNKTAAKTSYVFSK